MFLKLTGRPAGWPALQATEEEAARRLRLIAAAERVREQLIAPDNGALLPEFRFGPELANAEGLYGLQMRVVACESLCVFLGSLLSHSTSREPLTRRSYFAYRIFLAQQFRTLLPHLECLIPANKRAFLADYSNNVCESVLRYISHNYNTVY